MLKQSLIDQRMELLIETAHPVEFDSELSAEEFQLSENLKAFVPESDLEEFSKVLDDYECIKEKIGSVREKETYKQGLIDGFEIYSLVFSVK